MATECPGKLLQSINLKDARSGELIKGEEALKGKVVGVAIAPHWLPMPLRQTLASLTEHFDQIRDEGKPLALVYVTVDRDEEFIQTIKSRGQSGVVDERSDEVCFDDLCRQLAPGWLAVPLEESETRKKLLELKEGFFGLAFIGEDGETITKDGINLLFKWKADGYPFTAERIGELEEEAKERAANQSVKSLLASSSRDYVIKNDGSQVKIESLEGKVVALYFSAHWCGPCRRFTPVLAEFYKTLVARGEDFEVVFISADKDEESFEEYHKEMPWLALPFSDQKQRKQLDRDFDIEGIPTLVVLDRQGKTVNTEGVELMYKHGIEVYPFTPEKLEEIKAEEEKKRAAQTIESLLVAKDRDFVVSGDGTEVKVAELKGKTVGLYFSAHWCPPCRAFTPVLAAVYKELKQKGSEFEIVFISSDRDEAGFKEYYGDMPWLALPFSDRRTKTELSSYFEVEGIPKLVIIGPDGKTVTTDGRNAVGKYKAAGYPFTEDHLQSLEKKAKDDAANLPQEINLSSHPEHPLVLSSNVYQGNSFGCDICDGDGTGLVYHCAECSFDVHPECAKAEIDAKVNGEGPKDGEANGEGPKDGEESEEAPKDGEASEEGVKDGEANGEGVKDGEANGEGVKDGEANKEGAKEGWVCEGGVCKKV